MFCSAIRFSIFFSRFRPESLNKTSRACQRRINYMLKNKATTENVSLFLADLEQDSVLSSKFSEESIQAQLDAASASSSNAIKEQEHERIFEELVDRCGSLTPFLTYQYDLKTHMSVLVLTLFFFKGWSINTRVPAIRSYQCNCQTRWMV